MSEDPTGNQHGDHPAGTPDAQPNGPDGATPGYPPPGYGAAHGYPPQPGYPPPPGYGAAPGYPPQPGYPPPPGYGAAPGYPPQPGYPPSAYGAGAGQPSPWPGAIPADYYAGPTDPLVSRDFGGWWARSTALLKAAWRPLALQGLISVVPVTAVLIIMGLTLGPQMAALTTNDQFRVDDLMVLVRFFAPIYLVTLLVNLVVPMANTHLLVQVATGRPASISTALRAGLRRALPLLGWWILAGLIMVGALLACILPIVYVAAVFAVLPVIVLLEPGGNAIGRAFRLFHADIGSSVGRVATIVAVTIVFVIVDSQISRIFEGGATIPYASPVVTVISGLFSGAVSLALQVVLAPMYLTTYADMRARHEPFSTAYLTQV